METEYIIDTSKPFEGWTLNIIQDGKIWNSDLNFEEYNQEHGGKLIIVSEKTLEEEYLKPYNKSLQKPWEEITEEQYHDYLSCVPPKRWTRGAVSFFFMGECYTSNIYLCCAYDKFSNRYFKALREITMLASEIETEVLKTQNKKVC